MPSRNILRVLGASVSAIARRIGIHPSQLFAWRRDARAERHYRERHSSCGGEVASVSGAVIENCHWRGDRARRRGRRRGAATAGDPGGPFGMIFGVKVFLASHPVDFRKRTPGSRSDARAARRLGQWPGQPRRLEPVDRQPSTAPSRGLSPPAAQSRGSASRPTSI
ncbi:transposase [Bradyrhizobium elkanii]|uniref:transposase n=1 Tax=Bradyrhizobium elkanii TaxID=29448 RepID=UPI00096ACF09|nr:transposase [Bradyrhizobium sp. BRP56]